MNLVHINNIVTAFMHNLELAWRLFFDFRIPLITKIIFISILAVYVISPIDLIPDLLPVIGQMDDVAIFVLFMMQFINSCPVDIIDAHKREILEGEWKLSFLKYLVR
ncbi:MAG: YkvA family protein [Vampirovibrionia bacterium]